MVRKSSSVEIFDWICNGQPTARLVFLIFLALQYRPNHCRVDILLAGRYAFPKLCEFFIKSVPSGKLLQYNEGNFKSENRDFVRRTGMKDPVEQINNIANVDDCSVFDDTINWEKQIIKHLRKYCIWGRFTNKQTGS